MTQGKEHESLKTFSAASTISYEDKNLDAKKRHALRKKPRKEEAVTTFHQLVTDGSRYLLNSGIQKEKITDWMFEPHHYNNIKAATRWWNQEMLPVIRELVYILNKRSIQQWKFLKNSQPRHSDFRVLREKQKMVREKWYKRPRFKQDKGKVQERGY